MRPMKTEHSPINTHEISKVSKKPDMFKMSNTKKKSSSFQKYESPKKIETPKSKSIVFKKPLFSKKINKPI